MLPLINIDVFIEIFQNPKYRKKLDKIILNFFGLEPIREIYNVNENSKLVTLEFIIFIERQFIFKIKIKDNKQIFKESKKFYINFSFANNISNYILVYPCYWEFYCQTCLKRGKIKKDLENIAALLAATQNNDIKRILKHLKVFNKHEINDIINIVEDNKYLN